MELPFKVVQGLNKGLIEGSQLVQNVLVAAYTAMHIIATVYP